MFGAFEGNGSPLFVRNGGAATRHALVWLKVTFASGVATVAASNAPGVTVTRQGSTGIYDVVLPQGAEYVFNTPCLVDTADDPAATAFTGNWGVYDASAGTAEVRFIATGVGASPEADDLAPANTAVAHLSLYVLRG